MQRRFEVLDSHVHFMTETVLAEWRRTRAMATPALNAQAVRNYERHMSQAGNTRIEVPTSAADAADRWLAELDRAGVNRAVFMCPLAEHPEHAQFLARSDRFIGLTWLNPTHPEASRVLEREHAAGKVGVKLYPVTEGYHVDDRAAWPFYETAGRLGMFVLIHLGVTIGYNADLAFANPLDVQPAARDFPETTFVVAHFGAGFMRESLMLAYQQSNVLFDTSGSNNWLRTQVEKLTLRHVFERFVEGAGTERLLYGSDSTVFPRGYRLNVLEEQLDVIEALDITDAERALILGGNLKRLLSARRLPTPPQ